MVVSQLLDLVTNIANIHGFFMARCCTQLLRVLRLQLLRSLQIRSRLRRFAQRQLRAGAPQQRRGRGAVLQGTAAAPARNRAYFDGKICLKK